jgi:hypothetical protein
VEIPIETWALQGDCDDLDAARGVIVSLLIAIPFWVLIGVGLATIF